MINQFNKPTRMPDDGKFTGTWHMPFPDYLQNPRYPFSIVDLPKNNTWMHTDNEEAFNQNITTQPSTWKYRTKQITYNVNSHGYRTLEFNKLQWEKSIVLLGCSCTYGVGVAEDETIAHYISLLTNRPVINLGVPAGSNQLMLHNSVGILQNFPTPYAVCVMWTATDRFRYFSDRGYYNVGGWNDRVRVVFNGVNLSTLWKQWNASEYNELSHAYYTSQTMRYMWENRTKYVTGSYFENTAHSMRADACFAMTPTGRDLLHPGSTDNVRVAQFFASAIN